MKKKYRLSTVRVLLKLSRNTDPFFRLLRCFKIPWIRKNFSTFQMCYIFRTLCIYCNKTFFIQSLDSTIVLQEGSDLNHSTISSPPKKGFSIAEAFICFTSHRIISMYNLHGCSNLKMLKFAPFTTMILNLDFAL